MKKIKTAIIGYGFSGRIFQSPFVESNDAFELTAILQRHGNDALNDYPNIKLYRDYDELLSDESIELIIISTPSHLHFEHALKALEANKHVLVEKPFSATKVEAQKLIQKAKELNKVITVYQNRRFDGDILTIKKLINEGLEIYEYEATWDRTALNIKDKWLEEGLKGADNLYDLGTHFLDQAIHLFGEPTSIYGIAKRLRPKTKIDDYFSIELDYPDKMIRLKSCMHAAKPDVRYKLHTNKGTYYFYHMDAQEDQLLSGIRPLDKAYGDISNYDVFDFEGKKKSYRKELGNYTYYFDMLAKAIRENGPLPVSHKDILRVITTLESISLGELK